MLLCFTTSPFFLCKGLLSNWSVRSWPTLCWKISSFPNICVLQVVLIIPKQHVAPLALFARPHCVLRDFISVDKGCQLRTAWHCVHQQMREPRNRKHEWRCKNHTCWCGTSFLTHEVLRVCDSMSWENPTRTIEYQTNIKHELQVRFRNSHALLHT